MAAALLLALLLQSPAPSPGPAAEGNGDFTPFPEWRLFAPLLADPRDPHFSAAYRNYRGDDILVSNAASVSFGENIGLAGWDLGDNGRLELSVQAGVFAVFDLDASSFDLINADYLVGFPFAWALGPWSARARVIHQSSHLGDEFLLNNSITRINLSYETFDLKISRQIEDFRVYGGAGRMLHSDPSSLGPLSFQLGLEYEPDTQWFKGAAHPVAAVDVQWSEQEDWRMDVSLRAGILLKNPIQGNREVRLMLEYYHGRNPEGQFFDQLVESFGVGLHVYF